MIQTKTKRCYKCGDIRPVDDFGKSKERKDGLKSICKVCKKEESRLYRIEHKKTHPPISTFKIAPEMKFNSWTILSRSEYKNNVQYWLCRCDCGLEKEVAENHIKYQYSKRCSNCTAELFKARCLERRTVVNGSVLYPVGNPSDPWFKEFKKEQFDKQKGICPICEKQMTLSKSVFDHDHNTGECRELLHRGCNVILGWAERDPEVPNRINTYLKKYKFKAFVKSA